LLPDGKVLIAGGFVQDANPVTVLNTAELYDPATGKFSVTGNMANARFAHSATRLPDGRVLITGGYPGMNAEIYDSATGSFTSAGNMITSRQWHTATLLSNGKVLIAGGNLDGSFDSSYTVGDTSAELYDPATGIFSAIGTMTRYRRSHRAGLLANGSVLIVPGSDANDFGTAELYNPDAGTFSSVPFAGTQGYSAATENILTNGNALMSLQLAECDYSIRLANLFDASTITFSAASEMVYPHCQQTSATLADGSVLIVGNLWDGIGPVPGAEIYDPTSGTFSATGMMTSASQFPTATLLNNGKVLVVGGENGGAQLYSPRALVPAPTLFSLSGDGQGQGAIWHATTGVIASSRSPAIAGEALSMYTTSLAEGGVIPPQIAVGGRLAEVLYFGASSYPGYNQVNFRVPNGVAPGSAVPVRLSYLGRSSNEVTIGAR